MHPEVKYLRSEIRLRCSHYRCNSAQHQLCNRTTFINGDPQSQFVDCIPFGEGCEWNFNGGRRGDEDIKTEQDA